MNKEQLRQKIKSITPKQEELVITEWDSTVIIKELTAKSYLEVAEKGTNQSQIIPYLIISSVYTEDGEKLFTQKDIELILELPPTVLSKLILSINRLNGLDNQKN